MAYTARQLITKALYLSGICSRSLQVPTGEQITDGLSMLNDLLNFKQVETDLIPYWQYIEADLVPDTEFLYLPYVCAIESATFNIDTVRYAMMPTTRRKFYGSGRVDSVSSLPFSWNANRALGGMNLALYFKPQSDYTLKMIVKTFFTNVSLDTDLTDITASFSNPDEIPYYTEYTFINSSNQGFDGSYLEYLRYALARYICSEYGILFNPESAQILSAMERELMYVSPPDLSIGKVSILNADRSNRPNFGDVNIGLGWTP